MAIPNTPTNLFGNQANRQNYIQWDITPTATSYSIQRSLDSVTYTPLATSITPNYLDTTVTVGVAYYYQVAAVNISGTSPYTSNLVLLIPAPTAELSLYEIRTRSKQKADRVNSNFVTTEEWNYFINQAMFELYDLLVTIYEDYFKAPNATFTTNAFSSLYPLPDGAISFVDDNNNPLIAAPFYKLLGVDLALNTAQNAFVTMGKYNQIDRNRYLYPNSNSTIYGWQNAQYRVQGINIEFIPLPSGNQRIRLLYIPRLKELLADTDISTVGFSGWLNYVIVRAAIYALTKEESDVSSQTTELGFLKARIEQSSINRDAGKPDSISDTRSNLGYNGLGGGFNGPIGGY